MPLNRERCDCGEVQKICPECESQSVTPREKMSTPDPRDVIDWGLGYDEVKYTHVCWECGWEETVVMSVERKVDS